MLFNSYEFIFGFLPVTFFIFYFLGKRFQSLASLWLVACSLFFYAWWNPVYVFLLMASILFNFSIGKILIHRITLSNLSLNKAILSVGIACNLMLLGYYKYAHFFVKTMHDWLDLDGQITSILLPLGISFFTFTQIAFLVDAYRGDVKQLNFIHYNLFVTYFPHLIAGPVLHHKEMMPQFARTETYHLHWENTSVGLTLFTLGLFKKVAIADNMAVFANPVFTAATQGETLTFLAAWGGALAYTFQLYFDFSGYSDMAIGLSRLFGVTLPGNFNSPYQAINIIEFWQRWHMTLSRFLRDYLYIPLGGRRKGNIRRYFNLWITMLLGGIWHGAGWTFVVWGGLHGLYLISNHAWRTLRVTLGQELPHSSLIGRWISRGLTFFMVVIAWVFFRAENLDAAFAMLNTMAGTHGVLLPTSWQNGLPLEMIQSLQQIGITFFGTPDYGQTSWIIALWAMVWFMPNSQQIMADFSPTLDYPVKKTSLRWQPNTLCMLMVVVILLYTLTDIGKASDFLYFQF